MSSTALFPLHYPVYIHKLLSSSSLLHPSTMAPRMKPGEDSPVTQAQFELLLAKLTALESMPARLDKLEKLLTEANEKVVKMEAEVISKNKIINELKTKANSLEQYNRQWSVRVLNVPLPEGDETDPIKVMHILFNTALLPIFHGALSNGIITSIPKCDEILETAHILPGPDGKPKPIIARFYSRNIRAMIFRLKRDHATKTTNSTSSSSRSSIKFLIFEDLTKDTYSTLKGLADDARTGAVWTINGNIRYKLTGETEVRKVANIHDSIEDILRKK